ncbi:MAG TPA: hypothetical protein VE999_03115 [Gemmataceae bacterium]|nr:hypothetical protein [Gemmataceae bacterium]
MSTCSRKNSKLVSATGLVLAGLIASYLAAPLPAALGQGKKREPQNVSNAQLREGLQVLQATKKMLQGADHDYGGHRVAAIKAIGAAERQLKLALGSQNKGKNAAGQIGKAVQGKGKQPEPQNISNLQLADAIGILVRTRTFLEKADHDYGGHRAAAVRDIGVAVQQLKTALKYEKRTKG